jgi:hypothetical protein
MLTRRNRILIAAAVTLIALFFGLNPRDFRFDNAARWIGTSNGIRFGKFGIAYSHGGFSLPSTGAPDPSAFTVEIAVKPYRTQAGNFQFIASWHAGDDAGQLVIGQWRSSIIVMNGDDYDNHRRLPKIYAKNALPEGKTAFLTISTGRNGTRLFVDGGLAAKKRGLVLRMPDGGSGATLTLGNSVHGRHSWEGEWLGLAVFDRNLDSGEIEGHFRRWQAGGDFGFAQNHPDLAALYRLNDKAGHQARDSGPASTHLAIPEKMKILEKRILTAPERGLRINKSVVADLLINLLGFIPIGVAYAMFFSRRAVLDTRAAFWAVAFGALLSLSIELAQAWVPSRNSSLLDLVLNIIGAAMGAWLCIRLARDRNPRTEPRSK